jgi:hypothetical protein
MSADAPPAEEPMFAGLKKKSKKAKVNFDEIDLEGGEDKAVTPANIASETIAQAEEKLDAGDAPVAAEEDMFADLKKKPKKKKEIPMDLVRLASSYAQWLRSAWVLTMKKRPIHPPFLRICLTYLATNDLTNLAGRARDPRRRDRHSCRVGRCRHGRVW